MWQQGNTVVVTSLAFSGINDRNRLNLGHTDGFPIINRHKDTSGRIWDLTIIPPLKLSQHYVCPSLPAYCTQASLFRCLFVLGSLLSVHSPITLHWALVSVWPTSSSASAQRGPVGPRERPPWQSASLRRWGVSQSVSQSVSSQYHSVTTPAGHSSSSKSKNRLSIHPPRAHTLEVRLGQGSGANTGFWSDSSFSLTISFPLVRRSPSRGPGPLGERVWWSTVNICV